MRRLFLLLCLSLVCVSLTFSTFSYVSTTVKIYPDSEGNAHIIERITLHIDDENSLKLYDSNMGITNDITSWRKRTNIDNIRYHINSDKISISNLRVIPLPRRSLSIINPSYEAVLQIEYDANGMFNKTKIKARTYEYTMKSNALVFSTNVKGDIVLDENDNLYIILPDNVYAERINPLSQNVDVLKKDSKEFFWKGKTILENFEFVYIYEESMREEVESYFTDVVRSIHSLIESVEGRYLLIMLIIIIISYLMLNSKVNRNE